jgi:hypothetical protein
MSRFLNLRGYLILAAVVVALILAMSWCSDRARLKTMKAEARQGEVVGTALDNVAEQTPVIRQEQAEKQREVDSIQGADTRLPDGFAGELERVRRGAREHRNP